MEDLAELLAELKKLPKEKILTVGELIKILKKLIDN